MSSRQYLTDAAVRHQVFLLRYAGSTLKQLSGFIEDSKTQTMQLLKEAPTVLSKARYTKLLQELTDVNRAIYRDMGKGVKASMLELAKYEADFTQRLLNNATPTTFEPVVPTTTQLKAAAFTNVIDARPGYMAVNGITVGKALNEFGAKIGGDIVKAVRVGYALGQTTNEIADAVVAVSNAVPLQAQTLVRTITNHVASSARAEFYAANKEVLTNQYQIIATLDDRTCETCGALDGQVFDESDFEQPPYHWNCRCTYIAVVQPEFDVGSELTGNRPAQNADGTYERVSARTTYNSWIKAQPESFQREVLGDKRAALLRAGMPVQGFVDRNYRALSLEELRAKDTLHIFDKAGL